MFFFHTSTLFFHYLSVTHVAFSSYCLILQTKWRQNAEFIMDVNDTNSNMSQISQTEELPYFPILRSFWFEQVVWHVKAAGQLIQSSASTE